MRSVHRASSVRLFGLTVCVGMCCAAFGGTAVCMQVRDVALEFLCHENILGVPSELQWCMDFFRLAVGAWRTSGRKNKIAEEVYELL